MRPVFFRSHFVVVVDSEDIILVKCRLNIRVIQESVHVFILSGGLDKFFLIRFNFYVFVFLILPIHLLLLDEPTFVKLSRRHIHFYLFPVAVFNPAFPTHVHIYVFSESLAQPELLALVVDDIWFAFVAPQAVQYFPVWPAPATILCHELLICVFDDFVLLLDAAGVQITPIAELEDWERVRRHFTTQAAYAVSYPLIIGRFVAENW